MNALSFGKHQVLFCLSRTPMWLLCAPNIPVTPYLFPIRYLVCAGHIIVSVFIRNINSKYERRNSSYKPPVLPGCSLRKMAADYCSYKHPRVPFIDCETMLSPTPPHHHRFTRQLSLAAQRVRMAEQVSQGHPASVGRPQ